LHLLNYNSERLLSNFKILESVVKNFIVLEIFKQMTWCKTIVRAYHFCLHDSFESVDIVLESPSGKMVGIEIKVSETVTEEDFKGLKKLQSLYKHDFLRGIVLYLGSKQLPFGQDLIAMPINNLWSDAAL